jgi:hypothetical protein
MPSLAVYVHLTVTPHDLSGGPSDSPHKAIVEAPGARSKDIRNNRHMRLKPPSKSLLNILRAKSANTVLARAGLHRPGRWSEESVALPERPPEAEAQQRTRRQTRQNRILARRAKPPEVSEHVSNAPINDSGGLLHSASARAPGHKETMITMTIRDNR